MNKLEFIKQLSEISGVKETDCKRFLKISYFLICDLLLKGEEISFKGFGKFFVKTRKERFVKSKNKSYLVPTKHIVTFKIGKSFKEIIK